MNLIYRVETASFEEIYDHLELCDSSFMPALSSRVNLADYSKKIFEKGISIEAWHGEILVGMINMYLNDVKNGLGFITNVSVLKEYRGHGIASTLLKICLMQAGNRGFNRVRLEVSSENSAAKRMYLRAGFLAIQDNADSYLMECDVSLIKHGVEAIS